MAIAYDDILIFPDANPSSSIVSTVVPSNVPKSAPSPVRESIATTSTTTASPTAIHSASVPLPQSPVTKQSVEHKESDSDTHRLVSPSSSPHKQPYDDV